jgi:fructose-bisphosphate aldolase class I
MSISELQKTINDLIAPGKGVLAADESSGTIAKRFSSINVESTEETRRAYRTLLLTSPEIKKYLCGVILFEETLMQTDDEGNLFPKLLEEQGIVPGVKVDKGTIPLLGASGDLITQGLDGLAERLSIYKKQGARFTKWREVYEIGKSNPTHLGIQANAETLARYAAICQDNGFIPIVEPEILMDGTHSIEQCEKITERVLHAVFQALHQHGVMLEYMLLKPNMVLPGKESGQPVIAKEVAERTLRVLRRAVPAAVPSINFLSGGQSSDDATKNLYAMNTDTGAKPWVLSFSFARALQQPALSIWKGEDRNKIAAQEAFTERLSANSAARDGKIE